MARTLLDDRLLEWEWSSASQATKNKTGKVYESYKIKSFLNLWAPDLHTFLAYLTCE